MRPTETDESIEAQFGVWTWMGPCVTCGPRFTHARKRVILGTYLSVSRLVGSQHRQRTQHDLSRDLSSSRVEDTLTPAASGVP